MPLRPSALLIAVISVASACGPPRSAPAPKEFPSLAAGEHRWSIGLASDGQVSGADIALLRDRDLVVVGSFEQSLTVTGRVVHSAGRGDGFVARLDARGGLVWLKRLGGGGHDEIHAVATDAAGNVAIAGMLSPGATFGDGAPLPGAISLDRTTPFVAYLTADGSPVWAQVLRSSSYASIADLAFAPDGSLVAVGYFGGTLKVADRELTSAGVHDVIITRFAHGGSLLWARRAGGPGADQAHAVATKPDGILVVGGFALRAQFASEEIESQGGGQDVFVVGLDLAGAVISADSHGGEGDDAAFAIGLGDAGLYCVAGGFTETARFGGVELEARGDSDVFLACYGPDGSHLWSRGLGGPSSDRAHALAVRAGNVVLTGTFAGESSFAGQKLTSAGGHDVFATKLTIDGEPVWARGFGGGGQDSVGGIVLDSAGGAAITGTFARALSFGGEELAARGMLDGFAARLMD